MQYRDLLAMAMDDTCFTGPRGADNEDVDAKAGSFLALLISSRMRIQPKVALYCEYHIMRSSEIGTHGLHPASVITM